MHWVKEGNPSRRSLRPLPTNAARSANGACGLRHDALERVDGGLAAESLMWFLKVEGECRSKLSIEIVDIGGEGDPVSDELLERSPEPLESRGGVEVFPGRTAKPTSEALHGLLESAFEFAAEVGDDVLRFVKPGDGGLEEAGHRASAGFGGVGLKNEGSPGVGVEHAPEPDIAGIAKGVERREVKHPGVVHKAGDHRLGVRSVVKLLDHDQRGSEESLGPDAPYGTFGDFPACAGDGCRDGEGGSELRAVHGLNERTGDVGDPRDRRHRLHQGADGFGFFVDPGLPVGNGTGGNGEALSGEIAIPPCEMPQLEGLETLLGIVAGTIRRWDLEPPRSEKLSGPLRDVSAQFCGLEVGPESRDLRGVVSRSSPGETRGFAEEFRGEEKGSLRDGLGFGVEGALSEKTQSGSLEPSRLMECHQ